MGKAVARPAKTKAERLAEAHETFQMRQRGMSDYEVCQQLGISKRTLYRRIDLALTTFVEPDVDRYRSEQEDRLREYRRRLLDELDALGRRQANAGRWLVNPETGDRVYVEPSAASEVAAIVGKLLQGEERHAKLRGLDAPTRIDVQSEVDRDLAALAEELNALPRTPKPEEAKS